MRFRRLATIALTALAVASLNPVAQAQDQGVHHELPRVPVQMLTPDNPEFWNPANRQERILSPFGTQNVDCVAFHGDHLACQQNGVRLTGLGIPIVSEILYANGNGYVILRHPDFHLSSALSSR